MKESRLRIDSTSDAILLNRYVAYVRQRTFNTKGKISENIVVKDKRTHKIQWQNIVSDLKSLLKNPVRIMPHIGYSLAAFVFIFLGRNEDAIITSFFSGAIAFDAAGETSHSGEPATINWDIVIGSGSNRVVTLMVTGLDAPNAPTFDGNAITSINAVGSLKCGYYIAPGTGTKTCSATGGNIKTGAAISFTGADQTDPLGASTTDDNSTDSIGLTTEANASIRVDVRGAYRDDSTSPTCTLDAGTGRCDPVTSQNQFRIGLFAYTNDVATAGLTTRVWTDTAMWHHSSAFEIKAASAAAGPVGKIFGSPMGRMAARRASSY
jgi:hypothetical protein